MSIANRLLSGGIVTVVSLGLNSAIALAVNALLARNLSDSDLGIYLLTYSLAVVLSTLPQMGLQRLAVIGIARAIAQGDLGAARTIVPDAILLVSLGSVALVVALWIIRSFLIIELGVSEEAVLISVSLIALVPFVAIRNIAAECFRGFHEVAAASLHSRVFFNLLLFCALGIAFIGQGANLSEAKAVLVLSAAIAALAAVIHVLLTTRRQAKGLDLSRLGHSIKMLRGGAAITVSALVGMLSQEAHLWLVSAQKGVEDAGIYGVVARVGMLITLPVLVVSSILPQTIAELSQTQDLARRNAVMNASITLSLFSALSGLLVFVGFGGILLGVVFGDRFEEGHLTLVMIATAQACMSVTTPLMQLLVVERREREYAAISVVSTAFGLICTAILARAFGHVGGGMGMALGASSGLIATAVLTAKTCGFVPSLSYKAVFHEIKKRLALRKFRK